MQNKVLIDGKDRILTWEMPPTGEILTYPYSPKEFRLMKKMKTVLEPLLNGEFKDIQKPLTIHMPAVQVTIPVLSHIFPGGWMLRHDVGLDKQCPEYYHIGINPDVPEISNLNRKELRECLRHECLHILTGWDDNDSRFIREATHRGIMTWNVPWVVDRE